MCEKRTLKLLIGMFSPVVWVMDAIKTLYERILHNVERDGGGNVNLATNEYRPGVSPMVRVMVSYIC